MTVSLFTIFHLRRPYVALSCLTISDSVQALVAIAGPYSDETSAFPLRASAEMDRGNGAQGAGLRPPARLSGESRFARRRVFFRSQARLAGGDTAGLRHRGVAAFGNRPRLGPAAGQPHLARDLAGRFARQ